MIRYFLVLITLAPLMNTFAQLPKIMPQLGHSEEVTALCQNASFTYLFTADKGGAIKMWDIKSNKLLNNLNSRLSSADYLVDIGSAGKYWLLIHSKTDKKVVVLDYKADTIVHQFPFTDNLQHVRTKLIGKELAGNKYGRALVLLGERYRVYIDDEAFRFLDTIAHPFSDVRLFEVDKYALRMFVEENGGIQVYNLNEKTKDKKGVFTPLPTKQKLTNLKYNGVSKGSYKYLLLAACDSFYFVTNTMNGKAIALDRYVKINSDLRLIEKSLLQPENKDFYHYQYDQLGFLDNNSKVILGEMILDLTRNFKDYLDLPRLDFLTVGYKNYSQQDVLFGVDVNQLQGVYIGEGDGYKKIQLGGYAEVASKLFFNKAFNYLYSFTDHIKLWNLNEASLEREDLNWNLKAIDYSYDLNTVAFDYPANGKYVQIYDYRQAKYIASIPKATLASLEELVVDDNGYYTTAIWKKLDSDNWIIQVWNNTLDKEHFKLEEEGFKSFDLGYYNLEAAICTNKGVQVYKYPDFKPVDKFKSESLDKAVYAGNFQKELWMIQNGGLYLWNRKNKKLKQYGRTETNSTILDVFHVATGLTAAVSKKLKVQADDETAKGYQIEIFNNAISSRVIDCGARKPLSAVTNKDRSQLIVSFNTGEIIFYDGVSALPKVTLISQNRDIPSYINTSLTSNYVFYTDSNYYKGTRSIYDLVGMHHDNDLFSTAHYATHYNNPLKVLENLESKGEFVETMRVIQTKREGKWDKSPKELFDARLLPEVFDLNDSVPSRANLDTFGFLVQVNGRGNAIKTIEVYANGVPVIIAGQEVLNKYIKKYPSYQDIQQTDASSLFDLAIALRNLSNKDTLLTRNIPERIRFYQPVPLTNGLNSIEIFCTTVNGLKSKVKTYQIEKINRNSSKLYAIALSTSKYKQSEFNLEYAVKDGSDILKALSNKKVTKNIAGFLGFGGGNIWNYDSIIIDSFFDERATRDNFLGLKKQLAQLNPDDAVILFVSGHGVLDDNLDFWYAPHQMDFKNPSAQGISYKMITDVLQAAGARRKVLLLDACHSGEVDKSSSGDPIAAPTGTITANFRGAGVEGIDPKVGLQESFNLMKELFDDVNRTTGIQVISAASGDSYALESSEWKNGVFTYSILEALSGDVYSKADFNRDRKLSVSELLHYTSERVVELTNGAQKPTSRQINMEFDFQIW
jgi:WD40 repeat protein